MCVCLYIHIYTHILDAVCNLYNSELIAEEIDWPLRNRYK